MSAPPLDEDLGLEQRVELFTGRQLVAELAVASYEFDGSPALTETLVAEGRYFEPVVADFDGDGQLELLVESRFEDGSRQIVMLERDGVSWRPGQLVLDIPAAGNVYLAISDLDLDGDADIVCVVSGFGFPEYGRMHWLENRGGHDYLWHELADSRIFIRDLSAADLDGDGLRDLLYESGSDRFRWRRNPGGRPVL